MDETEKTNQTSKTEELSPEATEFLTDLVKNRWESTSRTFRLLYRHTFDDAEDLTMQTFLNIRTSLIRDERATLDNLDPKRINTWILTIIRNLSYEKFRKRRPSISLEDLIARENFDESVSPQAIDIDPFAFEELYLSFKHLSATEKNLIIMYYFENQTTEEIAKLLGLKKKAVLTRLYRARRVLKGVLEQESNN